MVVYTCPKCGNELKQASNKPADGTYGIMRG